MAICQVSDELGEFVSAVDKVGVVDDFAKNERIFQGSHITLISVTLNGVICKLRKNSCGKTGTFITLPGAMDELTTVK
ncbi:MAG: hypothetical protein WB762_16805 [Candidatus Sulfotelmatobacter sp.]